MPSTLFLPQLDDTNPVSVVANPSAGNADPSTFTMDAGGIALYNKYNEFLISWPAVENAVKYRLYGSVSPSRQSNLLQDNLTSNSTAFVPPIFTAVIEYYFWVSAIDEDGNEAYLSDTPASLDVYRQKLTATDNPVSFDGNVMPDNDGWNDEFVQDLVTVRAGNRFELENGGEPALLFLRRHAEDKPYGKPCACTNDIDDSDPDYQGRGRCTMCFGVGVVGGFYPAIPINIRYSNMPNKRYIPSKFGLELEHSFSTYMLWAPVVRSEDLIVRLVDGSRYNVTQKSESSVRGIKLHQAFDMEQLSEKDITYLVTDESIQRALTQGNVAGFIRDGFKDFG